MRRSKFILETLKENTNASTYAENLLLRAGYICKLSSGLYSFLPLGWRLINKLNNLFERRFEVHGYHRSQFAMLCNEEIWSKRPDIVAGAFKIKECGQMLLAPTNEAVVYKQLHDILKVSRSTNAKVIMLSNYFRAETRPAFGLCRTLHFIMQDAYLVSKDREYAIKEYEMTISEYMQTFRSLGLETFCIKREGGEDGRNSLSCEIVVKAQSNGMKSVEYFWCEKCQQPFEKDKCIEGHICVLGNFIEVAHSFYFDNFYFAETEDFFSLSFGVGLSRLMQVVIESSYDDRGMILPKSLAPFAAIIVPSSEKYMDKAEEVYNNLMKNNLDVIIDDSSFSFGEKMSDAELIGIRKIIVVGKQTDNGSIEVIDRQTMNKEILSIDEVLSAL